MAVKASGQITLSSVVDVKAIYRYYLLQNSTLTKPAKPTTFPPPQAWDDTEPTYTEGSTNSLYVVDCNVFSDDTYDYSDVSLSSSYEAAKAAYNKALNAENTSNSNKDSYESLKETVLNQSTNWKKDAEGIVSEAIKDYVKKTTYETFKETVMSKMNQIPEGFEFTFETVKTKMTELEQSIATQNSYIRMIDGNIYLGKKDNPVTAVLTNKSLEFRYNDTVIAEFTPEQLKVKSILVEQKIDLDNCWRIQKGAYISGKGYNMNINWIGG